MCLGGICSHVIHKYTTLTNHNNVAISRMANATAIYDQNRQHTVKINNRSQKIPLLNDAAGNSESDDDDSQTDNQNASDVIFDVLKRRDTRK